jgi:hypothetical protein
VRDLLQGIKDNSAAANAAKGTVLATPTFRNNFSNAVAHLATTLQLSLSVNDARNVSSSSTDNRGGKGGRTSNPGGRQGRGGRGRGHNIYLGSYTPEQWRKLSKEDKQKVYDGRQKSAAERNSQQLVGGRTNGGRGIASVVVHQDMDVQSQVTGFNTSAHVSNVQSHSPSTEPSYYKELSMAQQLWVIRGLIRTLQALSCLAEELVPVLLQADELLHK